MASVLIIDDDPAVCKATCDVFNEELPDVILYSATEGSEGISLIEKYHPDLVLLDLILAGPISSIDVLKEIQKRGFKGKTAIYTAYERDVFRGGHEREIADQIEKTKVDAYIIKTIHPLELVNTVKGLLNKSSFLP